MVLGLAACSGGAPERGAAITSASTADAAAAARIISTYRAANGLPPVTVNSKLNEAALAQARENAAAGRLDHGNFSARMYKFDIRGASAENLTAGSDDVAAAITRWKNSPGHNSNLLMREARQIGLARVTTTSGYRTYWALVLASDQSGLTEPGFL
jgi:Uncharacterized protein with SCP/PR1 domains